MFSITGFISRIFNRQRPCNIPVFISILQKDGLVQLTQPHHAQMIALSMDDCCIATDTFSFSSFHLLQCLSQDAYLLKIEFEKGKFRKKTVIGRLKWLNKAFESVSHPFLIELGFLDTVHIDEILST